MSIKKFFFVKFYGIDIRILHNFTARNFNFMIKPIKLSINDTTSKIMYNK